MLQPAQARCPRPRSSRPGPAARCSARTDRGYRQPRGRPSHHRPGGRRDRPGAAGAVAEAAGRGRDRPGGRARALRPVAGQPPRHRERGRRGGGRGHARGQALDQGRHRHARGQGRRGLAQPDPARGAGRPGDHPHRPPHPGRDARWPACTTRSRWCGWPSATPTAPSRAARRWTARSSPGAPSGSRAASAARWPRSASAPPSGWAARSTAGPKWTVSPVYEGMLKEEMDAAAERHPDVRYSPGADRRHLRRAGGLAPGRAAGDPGAEPRRRLPVGPGAAAVRLDRRRRVGAAGAGRRLRAQRGHGRGARTAPPPACWARTWPTRWR